MVAQLMPVSSESLLCSEFARSIDLRPAGTGLFLDRVILVSVPLPWPKPALGHPSLKAAAAAVTESDVSGRLFAAEPVVDGATVEVFERTGPRASTASWAVSSADHVGPLVAAISNEAVGAASDVVVAGATLRFAGPVSSPTFLICTQGTHDTCCGLSGVALADKIAAERPDYVIRRVSHTGGHRFSPTFLAFPEGRMWAFADIDLVDRIALHTETAEDLQTKSRGWWGAKVGAAQVAEIAIRSQNLGLLEQMPRIDSVQTSTEPAEYSCDVQFGEQLWHVEVGIGRHVPTIACEAPGGLPAKPAREFNWSISDTGER